MAVTDASAARSDEQADERSVTAGRRSSRSEGSPRRPDDRAVSEFAGVAILIAITLLVTSSVGLYVLLEDSSYGEGPDANFTYDYVDESSVLIVTHDRGESFTAGNLTVRSGETSVTWSQLAGVENETLIEPGATVQLSRRNAFGREVSPASRVVVLYAPPAGNETALDTWEGPER